MINLFDVAKAGVVIGLAGVSIGTGAGLMAYRQAKKTEAIAKKIGVAIDELADRQPVDIREDIVKAAVDKAVRIRAEEAVWNAANVAIAEIRNDMHKQIENAVSAQYARMDEEISTKVSCEVAKIDMEAFKRRVEDKAEQKIMDAFKKMGGLPKVYGIAANAVNSVTSGTSNLADILDKFPVYERRSVVKDLVKSDNLW